MQIYALFLTFQIKIKIFSNSEILNPKPHNSLIINVCPPPKSPKIHPFCPNSTPKSPKIIYKTAIIFYFHQNRIFPNQQFFLKKV